MQHGERSGELSLQLQVFKTWTTRWRKLFLVICTLMGAGASVSFLYEWQLRLEKSSNGSDRHWCDCFFEGAEVGIYNWSKLERLPISSRPNNGRSVVGRKDTFSSLPSTYIVSFILKTENFSVCKNALFFLHLPRRLFSFPFNG